MLKLLVVYFIYYRCTDQSDKDAYTEERCRFFFYFQLIGHFILYTILTGHVSLLFCIAINEAQQILNYGNWGVRGVLYTGHDICVEAVGDNSLHLTG